MSEYVQKSFTFWVSYFDVARRLNAKNRLALYDAIMDYMFLDIDREEELGANKSTSQAYLVYLSKKDNFKTSKLRAQAGAANKTESNDNQNEIKSNQNAPKVKVKDKAKEKEKEKGKTESSTPAACTRCGGVLSPTSTYTAEKRQRIYRCPECGEEVAL